MFLYNFGIHIFQLGLNIASLFKPKAKLWVDGRKNWKQQLILNVNTNNLHNSIWIHCASLGEFEQGRPVIQKIREEHPNQKIVLTFFSPSGYEIQKNYSMVDYVCYLPIDTKQNARIFTEVLKPNLVIFVKYEFWLNYIFELHKKQIPTFLISTVIKKHQLFFKWYGVNFRKALATYEAIYTQDEESLILLNQLNIATGKIAGDTRFDRVLQVCQSPKKINVIEQFSKNAFVVVGGSTWPTDEAFLIETYIQLKSKFSHLKLIIAPHEIDQSNINRLKNVLIKNKISYHLFSDNEPEYFNSVLILNTMGVLSSVYQYGNVAFVGGGFNNGIHNILEPSVFGLPVLFGPNHHKFNEAKAVIDLKAGFEIETVESLSKYIHQFLSDEHFLNQSSLLAKDYVLNNSGATQLIYQGLKNKMTH